MPNLMEILARGGSAYVRRTAFPKSNKDARSSDGDTGGMTEIERGKRIPDQQREVHIQIAILDVDPRPQRTDPTCAMCLSRFPIAPCCDIRHILARYERRRRRPFSVGSGDHCDCSNQTGSDRIRW